MNLETYFDKCVVINLKRRPDRLLTFWAELEKAEWPFLKPEVVLAVDGRQTGHPDYWKGGQGAWGCMRSHLQILETAISDGVERLLVMEDDCSFVRGFKGKVEAFLSDAPSDWQQLMIGGQHIHAPQSTARPGVLKVANCQRTHCFALRKGQFLKDLYLTWARYDSHCDWCMGGMQSRYKVYAPTEFLALQGESFSDITCRNEPRRLWSKAPAGLPLVLLDSPKHVAQQLRTHGLHFGYTIGPDGVDVGLRDAFNQPDPASKLIRWLNMLQGEAYASDKVLALWCPGADMTVARRLADGPIVEVKADTLEEALPLIPPTPGAEQPPDVVILLKAPREVADDLQRLGWHRGHWRDEITGVDNGLRRLLHDATDPRLAEDVGNKVLVDGLKDWLTVVGSEARRMRGGLLTVWHPDITLEILRKATDKRTLLIEGLTVQECLTAWENYNEMRR